MTKRFGFHLNSRGMDEIKDVPISIDFQEQKHGVVTPVYYYIYMVAPTALKLQKATELIISSCR